MKTRLPVLFAVLALRVVAGELVLAERGHPAQTAIVVRRDATPCERRAAEELRRFVAQLTGVDLPVQDDAQAVPARAVLLGDTAPTREMLGAGACADLGDEGFRFKAAGARLAVAGGPGRGPLYGVYELLERFGGCAWYADSFEVVPRLERFAVPDGLDETQRPAFALRAQNGAKGFHGTDWAVRNKMNPEHLDESLGGSRFRFDPVLRKCHTFNELLPPAKWFDSHPEYFSEVDGVRLRHRTQLCLTNPDVLRLCTEKVLERIAASYPKGIRYYGVSANDWKNPCACASCRAVDRREKSRAGTLVAFVNAVAEAVEAKYPDVVIQTLAYSYTRRPPAHLVPRRNVQVCFCTIECDFSRSLEESRALENRQARHAFGVWARGGRPLSVWDYSADFACWLHPWPNVDSLRKNLAFFRNGGADQVFELGDGGTANDMWCDLRAWLIAKWMWNPDLAAEPLLGRFFRDAFGPAAPEARRYFDRLHAHPRDTRRFPMGCFAGLHSQTVPDEVIDEGAELFARAAEKVAGSPFEDRVARARAAVDFVRALRGYARPLLSRDPARLDAARWESQRDGARRALSVLDRMRLSDDRARDALYRGWLKSFADQKRPSAPLRRCALDEVHFVGTLYEKLEFVDDPRARDGRALRLSGPADAQVVWFDFNGMQLDADGLYAPRLRIRTDGGKGGGAVFRAGVHNRLSGRSKIFFAPRAEDASDGYSWYTLGAFSPRPSDALWVSTGRRENAPDVFVDRLEVVRVR